MYCKYCNNSDTFVKDSRTHNSFFVKRKRVCPGCNTSFSTLEQIVNTKLSVVKKSKSIKSFDQDKIFASLYHISKKTNLSNKKLEDIFYKILAKIELLNKNQITVKEIVLLVKEVLKAHNEELYKRYCIIYS